MPVNILVADDSLTMRRIMELTFAGEDASVVTVDSGDAAIAKAVDLRPDVVLADASMATDGYKVASTIRATPGLERTAVIVLASQKHPYDEAKGKAAGVDDHVVKPFDTQHVIDKVKRVMSQPRTAGKPAVAAAPPAQAAAPAAGPVVRGSRTGTIAFERAPAAQAAQAPAASPGPRAQPPAAAPVAPAPVAAARAAAQAPVAAATASGSDLAKQLDGLGLNQEQIKGVLALSRDVIERVVWEVVPDLAETLIREEIRRLTQ
ncbi:MAG: PleD family two-component system response regulator [Polyangiales bacterium]